MFPNQNTKKRKYSVKQILDHAPYLIRIQRPQPGHARQNWLLSPQIYVYMYWETRSNKQENQSLLYPHIYVYVYTYIHILNSSTHKALNTWCWQTNKHTKDKNYSITQGWSSKIWNMKHETFGFCIIVHPHFWYLLISQKIKVIRFILLIFTPTKCITK